jgi:hypothetical protein
MAKEHEDMPRTDVGKEGAEKPDDYGKQGDGGKQGGMPEKGMPEKKEWQPVDKKSEQR